jgi:hypothetical protein
VQQVNQCNNELIFQSKEKLNAQQNNCCQRKAELYRIAGSAFVSLDEKVMSL